MSIGNVSSKAIKNLEDLGDLLRSARGFKNNIRNSPTTFKKVFHDENHAFLGNLTNGPGEVLQRVGDEVVLHRQKTGVWPSKKQTRNVGMKAARLRMEQGFLKPGDIKAKDLDEARDKSHQLSGRRHKTMGKNAL